MRKMGSTLFVFFVLVTFGLSLAFPAEDSAETTYDESETLPFQSSPPLRDGTLQSVKARSQAVPTSLVQAFSGSELELMLTSSARTRYSDDAPSLLSAFRVLRC